MKELKRLERPLIPYEIELFLEEFNLENEILCSNDALNIMFNLREVMNKSLDHMETIIEILASQTNDLLKFQIEQNQIKREEKNEK